MTASDGTELYLDSPVVGIVAALASCETHLLKMFSMMKRRKIESMKFNDVSGFLDVRGFIGMPGFHPKLQEINMDVTIETNAS